MTASEAAFLPPDWQHAARDTLRDVAELIDYLDLPPAAAPPLPSEALDFPLRVPRPYAQRMRRGDWNDPLLRQVLPLAAEQRQVAGFTADPLDEQTARRGGGLLHKYQGRALLILTAACAIHCRYCFRRHYPYHDDQLREDNAALALLAADSSLREVILSGGDPLSLSDERLHALVKRLEAIPHLRTLRIHTRLPVVIPARVTRALTGLLRDTRLNAVVVVHINHAQEIDTELAFALRALRDAGCWLLNQSVLLRGVNDEPETLCALSGALGELQISPYYLHLLDKVQGAAHFEVEQARAEQLMDSLRLQLPGYLVPKLVRELPGMGYKTPL